MRALIVGAMCSVLVAGCCKKNTERGEAAASEGPVVTATAAEIMADYKANEVRGDGKYKGKRVRFTGVVSEIKKDLTDDIMVIVGTGAALEIPSLTLSFGDEATSVVSAIDRGDKLTAECKCNGLMLNVNMTECVIPPSKEAEAAQATCKKLEAAGAVTGCTITGSSSAFGKGTDTKGTVMVMPDAAGHAKLQTKVVTNFAKCEWFASAKARTSVCLIKGAPADVGKKIRSVIDAL